MPLGWHLERRTSKARVLDYCCRPVQASGPLYVSDSTAGRRAWLKPASAEDRHSKSLRVDSPLHLRNTVRTRFQLDCRPEHSETSAAQKFWLTAWPRRPLPQEHTVSSVSCANTQGKHHLNPLVRHRISSRVWPAGGLLQQSQGCLVPHKRRVCNSVVALQHTRQSSPLPDRNSKAKLGTALPAESAP